MAHQTPTILFLKQSFLETQVRLLSRPLDLDRAWLAQNASADEPLPQAAVDDALQRLNRALAEHARRIYPPQSTRIVAEQINKLYEPGPSHPDDDDEENSEDAPPKLGADFTDSPTISSLPSAWPNEADTASHPMESSRYADLATSLTSLSARRAEVLERVRRVRRIQAALRPFTPDDDGEGVASIIQENLATRDGQVEKELEKMRMLLVRVGDRVARLPDPAAQTGSDDDAAMVVDSTAAVQKRKLDGLMDLF